MELVYALAFLAALAVAYMLGQWVVGAPVIQSPSLKTLFPPVEGDLGTVKCPRCETTFVVRAPAVRTGWMTYCHNEKCRAKIAVHM